MAVLGFTGHYPDPARDSGGSFINPTALPQVIAVPLQFGLSGQGPFYDKGTGFGTGESAVPTTGQIWPRGAANIGTAVIPTVSIVSSIYTNQTGTGSTTLTMTLPGSLVDGDKLFIAAVCADSSAGVTITPSTTGWTTETAIADQGTTQRAFYSATYSGGLAVPSWTLSATRKSAYICVAVRNFATPQVAVNNTGPTSLDTVAPAIGSAPIGLGLRFYVRKDNLSSSITPPAGSTFIDGALGVATGPSCSIHAYSTVQASAGAMATATATYNVTSLNSTGWTVSV